jgi:site-specific recombinase XerD
VDYFGQHQTPIADRECLTDAEVTSFTEAAKANRYGHRSATMILLPYRHGFRVAELAELRRDQIDFTTTLHVRRVKRGSPARIQSWVMNCALCASYSASRSPDHPG